MARWRHPPLLVFWLLLAWPAFGQANYTNDWFTVNGGGGTSTGGVYSATGTAGKPDAGATMSGGEYTVNDGFWGIIAVLPPWLTVRQAGTNQVIVCWPYPSEGYGLQQCTNLNTGTWVAATNIPVQVSNQWQVTLSPPQTGKRYYQFYRLNK